MNAGRLVLGCVAVLAILSLVPPAARAQGTVTGQWDFDNGDLSATIGAAGQYWIRPTSVPRDIAAETQFGTTTEFGIPNIGGTPATVMRFPACDATMGYAMYPDIDANGGGSYVNQYTIIFDILFPASSNNTWRVFMQTADCNGNDGDIFVGSGGSSPNPNGIGISGQYHGTIVPDTWHRVAFSFDLANPAGPTLMKFIDGVLVGTQTLSSGVDGRWSLYSRTHNRATLLFADNDGETNVGYVNSIQIRNYAMTEAEIAALGGPTAAGLPGGPGVTGQWDFDARNLVATVGRDLQYWRGCPGCPDQDLAAQTQFGTTADFGISDINGEVARVMRFPAVLSCTGYLFPHGAGPNGSAPPGDIAALTQFGTTAEFGIPNIAGQVATVMKYPKCDPRMGYAMYPEAAANGGGQYVNAYTIIMDILSPAGADGTWRALFNTNDCNTNDADFWIGDANASPNPNGISGSGQYDGVILPNTWYRVAVTVDLTTLTMNKYIDGTLVGTEILNDTLDGRWSLYPQGDNRPTLLFTDNDGQTNEGYVNSIQFRDYAMSPAEIAALGGPSAAGIPGGSGVTGQWDFDARNLAATVGRSLQYFTGCTPWEPKVNQYSLIMDVYFSDADYHAPGNWIALYQTNPLNAEDAMLWIRTTDGAIGDDGQYDPTQGSIFWDTWYRIAVVIDTTRDAVEPGTGMRKYVDGVLVGMQSAQGVDGKRALRARGSQWGDVLLMFTDEDNETKPGYVNSIQFRNYAMTDEEIAALGGASAAGIPLPELCATPGQDFDADGDVDVNDFAAFQLCFNGAGRPWPSEAGPKCACFDEDDDDDVDVNDFAAFQLCFNGAGRPPAGACP